MTLPYNAWRPGEPPLVAPGLVLTVCSGSRLVAPEAARALRALGWKTEARDENFFESRNIARLFALPPQRSGLERHPGLFFTVNFRGLDPHGEAFARWEAAGVPVAVWCVDNPWNLLAGQRTEYWKRLHLFVTDASFVSGLREAGAGHVHHLPLAAGPGFLQAGRAVRPPMPPGAPLCPAVFVGRSAFPDKERFFVGQRIAPEALALARERAVTGERPDFFWWRDLLSGSSRHGRAEPPPLWPGSFVRRVSLGAEESSAFWRLACLRAVPPQELTVFGDEGWSSLFGQDRPDLRPFVDYYGSLPTLYRQAEFSLSMTSFLLPCGLNQRHFDVWAAGGFCLTDATPGLEMFPPELTAPVCFTRPGEIPELLERFRRDPKEKARLTDAWQEHIRREHTYEQRMERMARLVFA